MPGYSKDRDKKEAAELRRNVLTGSQFGKLTVLSRWAGEIWKCRCQCGRETFVLGHNLKSGNTKSCGNYETCRRGWKRHVKILCFVLTCLFVNYSIQAADTTIMFKSWGDKRPADRSISLIAIATQSKDGLDIRVLAIDEINKVKTVVISSGVKVLATCTTPICNAAWLKASMAATNDLLVTVTPIKGTKFSMPLRLSRP